VQNLIKIGQTSAEIS